MIAMTPLGRIGQPSDITPIAVFLASDGVRLADGRWYSLWRPASRYSQAETSIKEIQMNGSSNLLVLGATGQVGKLVASRQEGVTQTFR